MWYVQLKFSWVFNFEVIPRNLAPSKNYRTSSVLRIIPTWTVLNSVSLPLSPPSLSPLPPSLPQSGELQVGDQLLSIDGQQILGYAYEKSRHLLQQARARGHVLIIVASHSSPGGGGGGGEREGKGGGEGGGGQPLEVQLRKKKGSKLCYIILCTHDYFCSYMRGRERGGEKEGERKRGSDRGRVIEGEINRFISVKWGHMRAVVGELPPTRPYMYFKTTKLENSIVSV